MIEYCFIFILILTLFALIKQHKFEVKDFILLVIVVLFAGLREGIGTDYNMYKSFYFNPLLKSAEKVETGFIVLLEISNKIFGDKYYLFFLLCSAITIIPIYYIFKKNSKYPGLSLLFFFSFGFFTLSFNMIRQFIAITIMLYSINYIYKKSFWKFLISIIIACFFHLTSLILLPMYFFANIKFSKRRLMQIFLIILIFATFLFNPIFNFVVSHIPQYSMYANYGGVDAGIGTYLVDLIYLFIIFFLIMNYEKLIKNRYDNICLNFGIISTIFIVLSVENVLFARLIYYFFIPVMIPLANVFDYFLNSKTQKVFNLFLIVILFIIYILNILFFNGVYPYSSIFYGGV